jgi:hypothetical protein
MYLAVFVLHSTTTNSDPGGIQIQKDHMLYVAKRLDNLDGAKMRLKLPALYNQSLLIFKLFHMIIYSVGVEFS